MELGKRQKLKAYRKTDHGFYLADENGEEVLLPNKHVPEDLELLQSIDVFVYLDSLQRIVCTTQNPILERDDFGFLEVKQISKAGYFLDLGIDKELFLPFREALWEYEEGEIILIRMLLDAKSQRLIASARINKYLSEIPHDFKPGDAVDIMVFDDHALGFNCLINKAYTGILYENEVFEPLKIGESKKAFIKRVRDDGKIDLSLQAFGYRKVEEATDIVLRHINENKGTLALGDKSPPEDIYKTLGMSKKVFKKALGDLYKQKVVLLSDFETKRLKRND